MFDAITDILRGKRHYSKSGHSGLLSRLRSLLGNSDNHRRSHYDRKRRYRHDDDDDDRRYRSRGRGDDDDDDDD